VFDAGSRAPGRKRRRLFRLPRITQNARFHFSFRSFFLPFSRIIIILGGSDLLIIHFIVFVNILFSWFVSPLGILLRLVRFVFCLSGGFFVLFCFLFLFCSFYSGVNNRRQKGEMRSETASIAHVTDRQLAEIRKINKLAHIMTHYLISRFTI